MASRFQVRARRLNNPPLWCWEIFDSLQGRVIESSWIRAWRGFASREEALEDGRRHALARALLGEAATPEAA